MFNRSARCEAVEKLRSALRDHENLRKQVERASVGLFEQRQRAVAEVIEPVEEYVNRLAHSPGEFDKSVREFRIEVDRFSETVQRIETEAHRSETVGGAAGVTGTAAGVGVATLGPSVAMAAATTFGTASTGTAISTLSGAAAANAALAWLGGGAVAAGGGGMAAGKALLVLAGDRWAGPSVVSPWRGRASISIAATGNSRAEPSGSASRSKRRCVRCGRPTGKSRGSARARGHTPREAWLRDHGPTDYQRFDREQKERLAALVNHVRALGELLRTEVAL